MTPRTLLASSSPRRKDLLSRLGISFSVGGVDADETIVPDESPESNVCRLAHTKLDGVRDRRQWDYILTADTIVCSPVDSQILGKPRDEREAAEYLRMLSGRTHRVLTGVCLYDRRTDSCSIDYEHTEVGVAHLTEAEIAWYVATGEWRDAAGGYRMQDIGSVFVSTIHGSPSNVIGLPMRLVYSMLQEHRYPFR